MERILNKSQGCIKLAMFILFCGTMCVFVLQIPAQKTIDSSQSGDNKPSQIESSQIETQIDLFKRIALKHGTDKVTTHHYQYVYGQLLGHQRLEYLNFLEIGLGCDMGYGPGKSLLVWKEYLPNAKISILEFNEKCARKFESQVRHLFVGDQSDFSLLKRIGETTKPEVGGRLFDVIIDDGGHTRKQQIHSLIGLWPFIRQSGGIYVIEDIFTSFLPGFNDKANESTIDLIFELIILLNNPSGVGFRPPFLYPNITEDK